jgi:hypothetical protein
VTQLSPATLAVVRCLARIVYEDFRAGQLAAVGKARVHGGDDSQHPVADEGDDRADTKRITRQ